MKTLILVGLVAATAFAQAPDDVQGRIYEEVRFNVDSWGEEITLAALRADGSYSTIVRIDSLVSKDAGEAVWPTIKPIDEGTYSYEKTAPDQATLILTSTKNPGSVTKPLVFSASSKGMVLGAPLDVIHFNLSSIGDAPIVNASARGTASSTTPLILGFYVSERPRFVLVRGVGPALAQYDVPDAAEDTTIEIVRSEPPRPDVITLGPWNDDWGTNHQLYLAQGALPLATSVGAFMGAFPLSEGSKDAALALRLPPGAYTAIIRTKSETPAEVLAEIYVVP